MQSRVCHVFRRFSGGRTGGQLALQVGFDRLAARGCKGCRHLLESCDELPQRNSVSLPQLQEVQF